MHVEFIDRIDRVGAEQWNAVTGTDYPFTRYEFLHALENSEAVCDDTGWQPHHLVVYEEQQLVAVMPLYLKHHSYGEYIFDWSWASAYERHGLNYYPKLLSAIPYTPSTGPRLCIKTEQQSAAIYQKVSEALKEHCQFIGASSVHILYPQQSANKVFTEHGLSPRHSVQYHWFNKGFSSFDDFLETFSSRKRKNLRKERKRVAEQGLVLERLEGKDISPELWQTFYTFYQLTYAKRSGHGGYLNQAFFEQVATSMPENLMLVMAKYNGRYIAGALNFCDSKTLYGRYWGCIKEFDFLHFEACYYQGIEYCIEHGLSRFDPGAQGEHKIQRGFTPIPTWSNHWIKNEEFRFAIDDFLKKEALSIESYIQDASELLPFKKM